MAGRLSKRIDEEEQQSFTHTEIREEVERLGKLVGPTISGHHISGHTKWTIVAPVTVDGVQHAVSVELVVDMFELELTIPLGPGLKDFMGEEAYRHGHVRDMLRDPDGPVEMQFLPMVLDLEIGRAEMYRCGSKFKPFVRMQVVNVEQLRYLLAKLFKIPADAQVVHVPMNADM